MIFNAFVFLGTLHLILMLRTDYKRLKIDSRHNRFMSGVAVFMMLTNYPGLPVTVGIILITFIIAYGLKRYTGIGDVEMASWALLGFGTLNIVWIPIYIIYLSLFTSMYVISMKKAPSVLMDGEKVKKRLPATPLFLGAFILTAATGYYLDLLIFM